MHIMRKNDDPKRMGIYKHLHVQCTLYTEKDIIQCNEIKFTLNLQYLN